MEGEGSAQEGFVLSAPQSCVFTIVRMVDLEEGRKKSWGEGVQH